MRKVSDDWLQPILRLMRRLFRFSAFPTVIRKRDRVFRESRRTCRTRRKID